jgi:hypothetical protein
MLESALRPPATNSPHHPCILGCRNSNSQTIKKKAQPLTEANETESAERKPWHHSVELASGALGGGLLAFLLRFLSLTPSTLPSLANDQAVLVLIMGQADFALQPLVSISFFALALACRNDKRKPFIATSQRLILGQAF